VAPSLSSAELSLIWLRRPSCSTLFPYTTLFRSLELQPMYDDAMQWEAGDLAQILAPADPLRPRDYSIASIPSDGALHLLVRQERSEEHTSELQSRENLVCRLLLENKKASTVQSA